MCMCVIHIYRYMRSQNTYNSRVIVVPRFSPRLLCVCVCVYVLCLCMYLTIYYKDLILNSLSSILLAHSASTPSERRPRCCRNDRYQSRKGPRFCESCVAPATALLNSSLRPFSLSLYSVSLERYDEGMKIR